jgi:hypothetical protein
MYHLPIIKSLNTRHCLDKLAFSCRNSLQMQFAGAYKVHSLPLVEMQHIEAHPQKSIAPVPETVLVAYIQDGVR